MHLRYYMCVYSVPVHCITGQPVAIHTCIGCTRTAPAVAHPLATSDIRRNETCTNKEERRASPPGDWKFVGLVIDSYPGLVKVIIYRFAYVE